jgi:hypothetical protein
MTTGHFGDSNLSSASELSKRITLSVAGVSDLDALSIRGCHDKALYHVDADNSLWRYDIGSTKKADADSVRVPAFISAKATYIAAQASEAGRFEACITKGQFPVDEITNPVVAAPAGLLAATATTVAAQTILAAAMITGGKAALAAWPRNVTFTTAGSTASDAPATATITGKDIDGAALTETVTLAQTATIAAGVKCFSSITSIVYAAADGTGATVAIGFGAVFGLSKLPKLRAGAINVLNEVAVGVQVTTGTFVLPATSAPYGSYAPASAPDGAKDYAITYERA